MIRIFCILYTLVIFVTSFTAPAFAGSWWEEEQQIVSREFFEEVFIELPPEKQGLAQFIMEHTVTPCSFHAFHYEFWKDMNDELDQSDAETLFSTLWDVSHKIGSHIICGIYVRS